MKERTRVSELEKLLKQEARARTSGGTVPVRSVSRFRWCKILF